MKDIKKIAVLGAGTMGAGIAAVCANAGREVLLLDLTADAAADAKQKLTAGRSPVIADEKVLNLIAVGDLKNDLNKIADCDWICEAVVEDLNIKRELFKQIEELRSDDSVVSTNTSGIPLKSIYADMPARLQQDIAVTHFFNPVHIMKLVELVPGENTKPEVIKTFDVFLGATLAKGVVHAKDTVNFIGNRIGCMWMLAGLHLGARAMQDGLDIETIDALTAAPLGLPPTGLYGLIDLIGLDVMHNVGKNLAANLPADDAGLPYVNFPDSVEKLYTRGQLGRKSGGGFYKLIRHDDGSKSMQVFDMGKDEWRAARKVSLSDAEQNLQGLWQSDSPGGRFVRELMGLVLGYTAALVPQISDDIVNIDRAMRWGFNWKFGPFEMLDELSIGLWRENFAGQLPRMMQVLVDSGADKFYHDGEFLSVAGEYVKLNN